jgi:hypothetical protein
MEWRSDTVFNRETDGYTKLLSNVKLDDIVPLYSTQAGHKGGGKVKYNPYWIVREGNVLRAEFQAYDDLCVEVKSKVAPGQRGFVITKITTDNTPVYDLEEEEEESE